MKKSFKRITGLLLSVSLAAGSFFNFPVNGVAAENNDETMVQDLSGSENFIKTMNTGELLKQFPAGTATFTVEGVGVSMGKRYSYDIVRLGDTQSDISIELSTIDITAGYGEDYVLYVDGEAVKGRTNRILYEDNTIYDVVVGEEHSDEGSVEGLPEGDDLIKATSSNFSVTIPKGENKKSIEIETVLPKEAKDDIVFYMNISDAKNAENGETIPISPISSTAFTIEEERQCAEAQVNIVGEPVVVDDCLQVMVERSGNTLGYTTYSFETEDGSAKAGEDYEPQTLKLSFAPGVTRERVSVPLYKSGEEEKTLSLKTMITATGKSSKLLAKYKGSLLRGKNKPEQRDRIFLSMDDFSISNTSDRENSYYEKDGDNYNLNMNVFNLKNETNLGISVKYKEKIDFTGIAKIAFTASDRVGNVFGDGLAVYAGDTDLYCNLAAQEKLQGNERGERFKTTELVGKTDKEVNVKFNGMHDLFFTLSHHAGFGWAGFNIYDNTVLYKRAYTVSAKPPKSEGGSIEVSNVTLSVCGNAESTQTVYRDDVLTLDYTSHTDNAVYLGYDVLNSANEKLGTILTDDKTIRFDADFIRKYQAKCEDDKMYIRPVLKEAEVSLEMSTIEDDATSLRYEKPEGVTGVIQVYDGTTFMGQITWPEGEIISLKDTINVEFKQSDAYRGNYEFKSFRVSAADNVSEMDKNVLYDTDYSMDIFTEYYFYKVIPCFGTKDDRIVLSISGVSHGTIPVKDPQSVKVTDDFCRIYDYDEIYEYGDIIQLVVKPESGYRAMWSYRDIASGETKVFYGNEFFYKVQVPSLSTDNYISLNYVPSPKDEQRFEVCPKIYVQGGDIYHGAYEGMENYVPVKNADISLGNLYGKTDEDGQVLLQGTLTDNMQAAPGETHTALIMYNEKQYVESFTVGEEITDGVLTPSIYLDYFTNGARAEYVAFYDADGVRRDGDVIEIDSKNDTTILVGIDKGTDEVNNVEFIIQGKDGTVKTRIDGTPASNGNAYALSGVLGTVISPGDEVWVELQYCEEKLGQQELIRSYGKVNTGYTMVFPEYEEVAYIPSIGDVKTDFGIVTATLGPISPVLSFAGFKPVLYTKTSGAITSIFIGLNFGVLYKCVEKKGGLVPGLSDLKKGLENSLAVLQNTPKNHALMKLTKANLTANFTFAVRLMVYNGADRDMNEAIGKFKVLCGYLILGIGGSVHVSFPYSLEGIPVFLYFDAIGSAQASVLMFTANGLPVDLGKFSTLGKAAFAPDCAITLNAVFDGGFGVGFDSLVGVDGSVKISLTFNMNDFDKGVISTTEAAAVTLDFLLFKKTFTIPFHTKVWENTLVPTKQSQGKSLMLTPLSEFGFKGIDSYKSEILTPDFAGTRDAKSATIIKDSYQFSKPAVYPLINNRFLIVTSLDRTLVDNTVLDKKTALCYSIYNENTGNFEIPFTPLSENTSFGALDYNPVITRLGTGNKFAVSWNRIEFDGTVRDSFLQGEAVSTVRAAIISIADDGTVAISETTEIPGEKGNLLSSLLYDEDKNNLLVFYRKLDFSKIAADTTIGEFSKMPIDLKCRSLNLNNTGEGFSEELTIYSADMVEGNLRNVDTEMVNGNPTVVYAESTGKSNGILSNSEECGSRICLRTLKYNGSSSAYEMLDAVKLSSNEADDKNNISPKIAVCDFGNFVFFQSGSDMCAVSLSDTSVIRTLDVGENAARGSDVEILVGNDEIYIVYTVNGGTGKQLFAVSFSEKDGETVWGLEKKLSDDENLSKETFSVALTEGNDILALCREGNADGTGNTNVKLCKYSTDARAGIVIPDTGDETSVNELYISNIYPMPGETVNLTAAIQNMGLDVTTDVTGTFYANDIKLSDATFDLSGVPSGNTATVSTDYVVPDDFTENIRISFKLASERGELGESTLAENVIRKDNKVEITSFATVQLNAATSETDEPVYLIRANVVNNGFEDSGVTKMMLSYLPDKYWISDEEVSETVIKSIDIPSLSSGEERIVSMLVNEPIRKYFKTCGDINYASLYLSLCENYGTPSQNLTCVEYVDLMIKDKPDIKNISADDLTLSVNDARHLTVNINPLTSQRFARLTYTSSDPEIAEINGAGILKAKKPGTCYIITTVAGTKLSKTVRITVGDVPAGSTGEIPILSLLLLGAALLTAFVTMYKTAGKKNTGR